MPRKPKEPDAPLTAQQFVEAAKNSLTNRIRARSLEELTEGAATITAELRKLAKPYLEDDTPDGFEELVAAMKNNEDLEDFVTPEIQALLEEFGRLANDAVGSEEGAARSKGVRKAKARHERKQRASRKAAESGEGENGLDPTSIKILAKARKDGSVKNNAELLGELGLTSRSSVFPYFKRLVESGLLQMKSGGRGAHYVPVKAK